ncbi:MAG: DUF4153 domain-containing protein [Prevotellaceae bacterium]|jgi:hypothetical protein|nr:DUF4153 domain-containing protein [Prevotellaceae bacterium]
MKKLNLSSIPLQFWATMCRFPLATLFVAVLFVIDAQYIADSSINELVLLKLNMLLPLGYALALAVRVAMENLAPHRWLRVVEWLLLPLLVLYYCLLPDDFTVVSGVCYVVLYLASLLWLGLAPFSAGKQPLFFWRYNVKIWFRLLLAVVCAWIFFGAVAVAIYVVSVLFNIHFSEKWFAYIGAFFMLIAAPLFFAAGIPHPANLTKEPVKPYAAARVVGQYILLPIFLLYGVILYAYGLRILVIWELPEGWVSWLILTYSASGLLIYFLLHNLYVTKSSTIAWWFGKYFFYTELPVIALMSVGVLRRISDYGITESRYYLLLSVVWLLTVSLYMIFTRGRSFRPVLLSLGIAALLSLVGPWSAFHTSDCSQMHRLRTLMEKNDLLSDGKYVADTTKKIDSADHSEMTSIIYYLVKCHGIEGLQEIFPQNLDSLRKEVSRWSLAESLLGTDDVVVEVKAMSHRYIHLKESELNLITVTGYDRVIYYSYKHWKTPDRQYSSGFEIAGYDGDGVFHLLQNGKRYKTFDLNELLPHLPAMENYERCADRDSLTQADCSLIVDNRYKLIFASIGCQISQDSLFIENADMYILEKNKD